MIAKFVDIAQSQLSGFACQILFRITCEDFKNLDDKEKLELMEYAEVEP